MSMLRDLTLLIFSMKHPQLMLAQGLDLEAGGLLGKRLIIASNLSCMFQPKFYGKALFSGKWVMGTVGVRRLPS